MEPAGALEAWIAQNAMMMILAFARIGTALILMPGFGDARIPPRAKVAVGVLISLCMMSALPLPAVPDRPALLAALIACEVLIGGFLGMAIRLFFVTVHILGGIIGYAAGLSNAFAPPDANFEGASTIAALLQVTLTALMFATDTHHLVLGAILRSYQLLPPGTAPLSDMTEQMARLGASAFYMAVMVGAPFLLFTVLFNLGLGLANRVMAAMQVFLVASPGMIMLGLAILAVTAPAMLTDIGSQLADWLVTLER